MSPTPGGDRGQVGAAPRSASGGTGVFGGTFDPPHIAHIAAAAWARHELVLDRVLLVVAGDPWQKSSTGSVTAAEDRLAMAMAACEGVAGVEVCDLEVRRAGPSFTVETLAELRQPGERLVLVLGADAVAAIPTWHRHTELAGLAELAIVERPGGAATDAFNPIEAGFVTHRVALPRLDVSSTAIRARLRANEPVDGLVPPAVLACVRARGLYRGEP